MKKTLIITLIFLGLSFFSANAATVGTTGADYATLKLAFDAINNGTLTGDVVLQIVDNTSETATASLNASGVGNSSYTSVIIYPTVDNLSITSDAAFSNISTFIDLNGADNVTIDGRVNQSGARSLTIASIMTGASTISLNSDATYNIIKYCNIKGNATSQKGVLVFSTGATLGNSNNTVEYNLFTNNGTRPVFTILSSGTASFPNAANTISNNEFKDCFAYATTGSIVLYINGQSATGPSNLGWTISGNSFYETTTITNGTGINGAMGFINIGSSTKQLTGTGYLIENNYIGGTAAQCGGGTLTKTGVNAALSGILVYLGEVGNTCSIQNNTIQKISWTNNPNSTFRAIEVLGLGNYEIGTTTGNTIGDNTTENSIVITNATTASSVTGISILATGTVNCKNNKIGSIKSVNTVATNTYGITKTGAGTANIVGNIIGSTTMANSINASSTAASSNAYGINFQGTATDNTISKNTISNINNNSSSGSCYGIGLTGAGTTTINANFVHSLTTGTSATTAQIIGIGGGTNTSSTVTNNVVALVGNNNPASMYGIYDPATAISTTIYHNTVYIGGAPTTLALKSYPFYSGVITLTSPSARYVKNNIFANGRLNNGATGNNAAIGILGPLTGSTGTFEWDKNGLWSTGNAYNVFAYFNNGLKANLATWQGMYTGLDANSLNIDPSFANAGGTLAEDYKPSSAATLTGTPINTVTIDYAEIGRSATQPKMGAYETSFSTGINNKIETIGTFILRNETGIIIPLTTPSKIELYGINGMLIEKTIATGNYSRSLNNGMYIILINGKPTKFLK